VRVSGAGRVEKRSAAAAGAGRRVSAEGRAATEKRQESAKGPGNVGQPAARKSKKDFFF
jgi:hypothetical protein